jgi:hypothetical protein
MQTGSFWVVIIVALLAGLCPQPSFAFDESYDAWLRYAPVDQGETRQVRLVAIQRHCVVRISYHGLCKIRIDPRCAGDAKEYDSL